MKRKRKTVGKITNSRGTWAINPATRVTPNKKAYNRNKLKQEKRNDDE